MTPMDLLTHLNAQQREAVTASDGAVLVLAGPGSGKTRVLTRRVAWLVLEQDIAPWHILAVTFTNKAAREMRARLDQLLGASRSQRLSLGTFHAICARVLRQESEAVGISKDYVIFDSDDQLRLVRQALKELNLDDKRYRPQAIHSAISRAKNELVPPESYDTGSYYGEIVKRVYERYQAMLALNHALDFDDLLTKTVWLFERNPGVLARYQERYHHILVDEFQDTNQAQYRLLHLLAKRQNSLFCVADEDQSIYAWRGADYRNIRRLRNDHPDLRVILLEQNYRSTQTILDAARGVIRRNPDRTDKALFTEREAGPKIVIREAYDADEEARTVVDTIAQLVAQESAKPGDCAIMYRTNAQSRALEDAFMRAGLPYRLVGATRFYARAEIKDLIAFLRLIHNPADSISLTRVINVPARAIGQKTVASLESAARDLGVSVYDVVKNLPADLGVRAQRALAAFEELVEGWLEVRDSLTVVELIDRVLQDTRYAEYLRDGTDEGEDRWNNILELRSVAAEYAGLPLTEFLAEVALVSDVDSLGDDVDAPTLLTLHAAKGLEFPIVFITGLEEGVLPHSRSLDDGEQLAEERRLLYVGMTRAKDQLYLSYAFIRSRYGDNDPSIPSSFLNDIPSELVAGRSKRSRLGAPSGQRATTWDVKLDAPRVRTGPNYSAGQRVRHKAFGEGLVIESRSDNNDEIVTVLFEDAGLKRLMAGLAALEVLSN
ncbi:MAG: UvrD-helicase domain-containing protein [Chloroflexi bacterium]|nr:UvrD-helicase domain-containing protein [Chloroflexota bacterium]